MFPRARRRVAVLKVAFRTATNTGHDAPPPFSGKNAMPHDMAPDAVAHRIEVLNTMLCYQYNLGIIARHIYS